MPFNSAQKADERLLDATPLSEQEIRDLFPWLAGASHRHIPRVQIDVALQQIAAINRFNDASGKLTRAAIFVGCGQVAVGLIAVLIALYK